jgi:hypothetical protein
MGTVQNPAMEETEVEGEDIVEAKGELTWKHSKDGKFQVVRYLGNQKFSRPIKTFNKREKMLASIDSKEGKKEGWSEETRGVLVKKLDEVVSMKDLGFKPTTSIGGTSLIGYIKGTDHQRNKQDSWFTYEIYPWRKSVSVLWAISNDRLTITIYDYTTGGTR